MSTKTKAAAKREVYQAISLMSRARAFAVYSRLNAKGRIKRGDSFEAWLDRAVEKTVASWFNNSTIEA